METKVTPQLPAIVLVSTSILDSIDLLLALFKKSLPEHNKEFRNNLENDLKTLPKDENKYTQLYTFDTKYYTANVRILCMTHTYLNDKLTSSTDENISFSDLGASSVESLIFVSNLVDGQNQGVSEYKKMHNFYMEKLNPEVTICFANQKSGTQNVDLYSLFEFGEDEFLIEIIDDDLSQITDLDPTQKPNVEKNGVERVIESLECHMWPTMVKKKPQQASNTKKEVIEKPKEDPKTNDEKTPAEEPKQPTDTNKEETSEKKEDSKKSDAPLYAGPLSSDDKVNQIYKEIFQHDEDNEKELEDLAGIFQQMNQLRNNQQNLSDKDRREQAAQLIMKLMSNCKDLDGDDYDDDQHEDSDDDDLADMKKMEEMQKKGETKAN